MGENRSKISVLQADGLVGQSTKFLRRRGRPPPMIFVRIVRPMSLTVFTQTNTASDCLSRSDIAGMDELG